MRNRDARLVESNVVGENEVVSSREPPSNHREGADIMAGMGSMVDGDGDDFE